MFVRLLHEWVVLKWIKKKIKINIQNWKLRPGLRVTVLWVKYSGLFYQINVGLYAFANISYAYEWKVVNENTMLSKKRKPLQKLVLLLMKVNYI